MLKLFVRILPYFIVALLLYFAGEHSYLLFHTSIETVNVVVSAGLFMLVWNARKILHNNYFLFVSIVSFLVGIVNFLHLLSYRGMPFFQSYGLTVSSQLWIVERALLSISLLVAFFFINRRLNEYLILFIYSLITSVLLATIFVWRVFPVTYIAGIGLTPFKVAVEYVISGCFLIAVFLLRRYHDKFDHRTYWLLISSGICNVIAEILSSLYVDLSDSVTMMAHITVLFSYFFIYRAVIEIGLTKPYRLLFLELQTLSQRKDELLSIASHELKNPLTALKLYSKLLTTQAITSSGSRKILQQIQDQTDRINILVNDLGDIGKIETGQFTLHKTRCEVTAFVASIIENFRKLTPEHRFVLRKTKPIYVYCDKDRLGQVFINVLTNAVKYSASGSQIIIKIEQTKQRAEISIKDAGRGIPKDKLAHIFDKYYRADQTDKVAGLGLGLYISKEIINSHQGKIWVDSELGKGSTFHIALPINQPI